MGGASLGKRDRQREQARKRERQRQLERNRGKRDRNKVGLSFYVLLGSDMPSGRKVMTS